MSAATDWVLQRLAVGPAYLLPLAFGVARAIGQWDDAREGFEDAEAAYRATDEALAELIAAGKVRADKDGRGQGPVYLLVACPFSIGQRVRLLPGISEDDLVGATGTVSDTWGGDACMSVDGQRRWVVTIDLDNGRRIKVGHKWVGNK